MASYNKLWKLLIDKKHEQEGSDRTFRDLHRFGAKLSKGQNTQTDVLCKICKDLNCDFKNIMEYIPGQT